MAMTNNDVKAILDEYGKRVKCLCFEHKSVVMNQPLYQQPILIIKNEDVKFKTVGETEYIIVPSFEGMYNNKTTLIMPTDRLVKIVITDVETDRIDVYNI